MVQTEVKITQFTSITKNKRKEEGDNQQDLPDIVNQRISELNNGK